MSEKRRDDEPPDVIGRLGWRYHHVGIPHAEPRPQERHLEHLGVHVCGFDTSPYGIEWMRFEPHCRVPDIVRTVPHVAFVVDDLDEALKGREILIEPNAPSDGVRVAFILHDGAPIELLEFSWTAPGQGRAGRLLPQAPPAAETPRPLRPRKGPSSRPATRTTGPTSRRR